MWVVKGNGIRCIGDDVSPFTQGELIIIGENTPHNFISNERDTDNAIETICIQFSNHLFQNIPECKHFKLLFEEACKGIYIPIPNETITQKIEQFIENKGVKSLINFIELIESIYSCTDKQFILTEESQKLNLIMENSKRLNAVLDFIHANFLRNISLNEIAAFSHYTPNSFSRWFRNKMGMPFLEYLQKVRISYACQLLI